MYASYDAVAKALHQFGSASEFRIGTSPHDAATQVRVGEMAEARLERAGIRVGATILGSEIIEQNELSFAPVIVFLLAMAVLIAFVGGLGLMSTMSMNVLERTRELGVMRAIGASDGDVVQMVVVEGLLIGLISWGLGTALAVPISRVLGTAVGVSLMSTPLAVTFAGDGFAIWLVVVLVLSALASILPARNASRITIRDALVYE
jgi:putative ABC transport system permease protein